MKCAKCNSDNLAGTKYCQKCGGKVKEASLFTSWKETKFLAGMGAKGSSLAPLGAMAVEEQSKELGSVTTHKTLVKVLPLDDGRWYCPDCGELNDKRILSCKGCGRDYI